MNAKEREPSVGAQIKKDTPRNIEGESKVGKDIKRDEYGRASGKGINFGSNLV